jgi:hypothetical protein
MKLEFFLFVVIVTSTHNNVPNVNAFVKVGVVGTFATFSCHCKISYGLVIRLFAPFHGLKFFLHCVHFWISILSICALCDGGGGHRCAQFVFHIFYFNITFHTSNLNITF